MAFTARDLAGYRGKEIEVWVCKNPKSDPGADNKQDFAQVRGAQNFNTTEERPAPDIIEEMGFEATKAIYGPASYSLSTEIMVRDLVHIARLSGLDPTTAKKINVSEFNKTNALAYFRDPDTGEINLTKIVSGFKARTASTPMAVGANSTITLEGSCDVASSFDGKALIVEYEQQSDPVDGTNQRNNSFDVPVTSADDVYQVEEGEGILVNQASDGKAGWTFTPEDAATPTKGTVKFVDENGDDLAPDNGLVIRIVHKTV